MSAYSYLSLDFISLIVNLNYNKTDTYFGKTIQTLCVLVYKILSYHYIYHLTHIKISIRFLNEYTVYTNKNKICGCDIFI